jgi:hypothetical protein
MKAGCEQPMNGTPDEQGYLWPTPAQERLLKAALDQGDSAREHFYAWRDMIDIAADFDRGSFRLLPLLYANLSRLNVEDSLMGRLKGTYRRAWCEAQTRFEQACNVLTMLNEHGIDTMVIKGIPLSLTYYASETLRPMADIDVVVPHRQAAEAVRLIDKAGWARGPWSPDDNLDYHHAMQFFWPAGGELDVHWHFLTECRSAAANEQFWTASEPLDVKGVKTRQLGHTDMFIHTVIHGIRWNPEPPIRWIADAAMILRRTDREIDWDRLLAFSDREKLNYRMRLGLTYLAEHMNLPIPATVLDTLAARPNSWIERLENSVALRDTDHLYRNPLLKNWVIFVNYCRFQQATNPWQFVEGFTHFLRVKWELGGRSEIPGVIWNGLVRRMLGGSPSSERSTHL